MDTYYNEFLNGFYSEQSSHKDDSYRGAWRDLMDQCFGTSDFYSANLKELGWEAHEVVANCVPLQRKWARDHNLRLWAGYPVQCWLGGTKQWLSAVVRAQIKWFKPDVLYVQDLSWPDRQLLLWAKSKVPLLVGQHASLVARDLTFDLYDLVVSSLPNVLNLALGHGAAGEYLKLAFEPKILNRLHRYHNPWPVVHVGGYGLIHNERNTLLEKVANQIRIDFWGYGVENLRKESPVRKNYHGEAWGLKMHEIRHNSLIVLTGHISEVADRFANNMTLYEATGVGACLVTDLKENLPRIFEPEQEVVTYRHAEECGEKVRHLLDHEEERAHIAKRGQERTLREHNYHQRMKELVSILQRHLSISGRSGMRSKMVQN